MKIGKNKEENWKIYNEAEPTHTIFHLDSLSSPYVIVPISIEELTPAVVIEASQMCKLHSKYRNYHQIKVMYTAVSNTRLGAETGSFVVISNRKVKIIKV